LNTLPIGVVKQKNSLYTVSHSSRPVYGEKIRKIEVGYLREWNPKRSKLAAAIVKRIATVPLRQNSSVLYLGAASGTTVSHISDICSSGRVYAIEKAYDPFVQLLDLSQQRDNIYPIIEDAGQVDRFRFFIDRVDMIYQDIAQRNQVQIFNSNAAAFSDARDALLVLKIRAISSKGHERDILQEAISRIEGFRVLETVDLSPFSKSNYMLRLKRL
jgi:fibrillarin-like pre-rRNA processing protein